MSSFWAQLDEEVEATIMPEEYRNYIVKVRKSNRNALPYRALDMDHCVFR